MTQPTYRLPIMHFLFGIITTSLSHAIIFALLFAVFTSIVFMNSLASALTAPLLVTIYISSYAVHELGHYHMAQHVKAQPVVWMDVRAVSIVSRPRSVQDGRLIALAGPVCAAVWIFSWWVLLFITLPAYRFASLIPAAILASAHLGNLLPFCSDGKAVMQVRRTI